MDGFLAFFARVIRRKKKEQLNFRIREKRLPAEIPHGNHHNSGKRGIAKNQERLQKPNHNRFDKRRPLAQKVQSVSGGGKFLLQPRGFSVVQFFQFTALWGLCEHAIFSSRSPRTLPDEVTRGKNAG